MRSKHEIPNKTDYMKAYSFNLILTERTNSELENVKNIGHIDGAFYRNFSWQIMGKERERQLSHTETKEVVGAKRQEALSEVSHTTNGRHQGRHQLDDDEDSVEVESRTDFKGSSPKRYVSTCYLKPKTVPSWYRESLLIRINSTKRIYDEYVWFKNKLQPYYWSENMTTEVNFPPSKIHTSQVEIPVAETEAHYISLEPQQIAAGAS